MAHPTSITGAQSATSTSQVNTGPKGRPAAKTINHQQTAVAGNSKRGQGRKRKQYRCRATQLTPAKHLLHPGEAVALDIEFQNFKHVSWEKRKDRIGRIAIVNTRGDTTLDVYAAYPNADGVEKFVPPPRFLVDFKDFSFDNGAVPAAKVERWVKEIIRDRTVIVHGGKSDLTAFTIEQDVFARSKVVDTQPMYGYLHKNRTPKLETAAEEVLGYNIQYDGFHSALEDALATMMLWGKKQKADTVDESKLLTNIKVATVALREIADKFTKKQYRGVTIDEDGFVVKYWTPAGKPLSI